MMVITNDFVFFNGDFLSNFHLAEFSLRGYDFRTVEQAFQFSKAKFFKDENSARKILACTIPAGAKNLGSRVSPFDAQQWAAARVGIMRALLRAKFDQNFQYKKELCRLHVEGEKPRRFVEARRDSVWGIGLDMLVGKEVNPLILKEENWRGTNLLGELLTLTASHYYDKEIKNERVKSGE